MHEREGALEPRVGQVGEERLELGGGEHALVDEGPGRERGEVGGGGVLGALAQPEDPAVEVEPGEPALLLGDVQLGERRHRRTGRRPDQRLGDRQVAPPEHAQALAGGDLLDGRAGLGLGAGRQEDVAHGVVAGRRKGEARDLAQEPVRDLDEDARSVAAVGLGTRGAAVVEVRERGKAVLDDGVARDAGQGGDERDAAGVVLERGVVEPLAGRQTAGHGTSPVVWH